MAEHFEPIILCRKYVSQVNDIIDFRSKKMFNDLLIKIS